MATKSERTKQELEIEGRRLTLTNLGKVLYRETGFTKGQVIDYYIRSSTYLLPHFAERPVTLHRLPDGPSGHSFYEKNKPRYAPDWLQTFFVPRRDGSQIEYILINNLATLVWCANFGSLELHPFLHRAPAIDQPTQIVFDLDPGDGVNILGCAEIAFLLKDLLEQLGLASYAKVSGSKGLQLYVPLNTPVTYENSRPFAKAIAEKLAKEHPDRIVSEMAKTERSRKVFIDWSQNSDFKTTIGVYSLRAKLEKPFVSAPVTWDELGEICSHGSAEDLYFAPAEALERFAKEGDLFAPVLERKQSLPDSIEPKRPRARKRASAKADPINVEKLPHSLMRFAEPMLAKLVTTLPSEAGWHYEIKLDGYRALAIKDKGEVQLLSRRNNSYNTKFSPLAEALAQIQDGVILDGEVVALDEEGRPVFNVLQHYKPGREPLVFYAFDVLAYRGRDTRSLPLEQRYELLQLIIPDGDAHIRRSVVLQAAPEQLIEVARSHGLEGIVAKRSGSRYQSGERSGDWVKFKTNQGQELVVGGYKPGGAMHFDNLAIGYYEGDSLIFIAKLKNGFTPQAKTEIWPRLQELATNTCPFANLPEPKSARRGEALTAEVMKGYRWIQPELVVQVEFTDWTSSNHLRHSNFVAVRDDKDPREVVHEQAQ